MASLKLSLVLTIVCVFAVVNQGECNLGVLLSQANSGHPIVIVPKGKSAAAAIAEEKILASARSAPIPDEVVLGKSAAALDLPIKVGRTVIGTTKDFPAGLLISPPSGRSIVVDGKPVQSGKSITEHIQEKRQQQGKAILKILEQQQQQGKAFHHQQQQQQQQQQRAYSRRRGHRQRYPSSESSESGSGSSSSSSSSESYERPSRFHGRGLSTGR